MPEPVKVSILDREFLIACPEEEKAGLLQSADYLSRQMREIRDSGKIVGMERIAVMAALNITHEMIRARDAAQTGEAVRERLARVDDRIRRYLENGHLSDDEA